MRHGSPCFSSKGRWNSLASRWGELIGAKMAQVGELIGVRQMSQKLVDTPTTACWGRGPGDPGKSQDVGTLQVEAAARTADMSTDFRAEMRHAVRQMK